MIHHICAICGFDYDATEEEAEDPVCSEVDFEDLPTDWSCPFCGAAKDDFSEECRDEDDSEL